jgi:hypothetical protein
MDTHLTALRRTRRRTLTGAFAATLALLLGAGSAHARVYTTSGYGILTQATYTALVDLNLPPGKYFIVAKGLFHNQQTTAGVVSCNMYGPSGHLDVSDAALAAASTIRIDSYATIPFHIAADLPTGGRVWIECIAAGTEGIVGSLQFSALRERSIVVDP